MKKKTNSKFINNIYKDGANLALYSLASLALGLLAMVVHVLAIPLAFLCYKTYTSGKACKKDWDKHSQGIERLNDEEKKLTKEIKGLIDERPDLIKNITRDINRHLGSKNAQGVAQVLEQTLEQTPEQIQGQNKEQGKVPPPLPPKPKKAIVLPEPSEPAREVKPSTTPPSYEEVIKLAKAAGIKPQIPSERPREESERSQVDSEKSKPNWQNKHPRRARNLPTQNPERTK